MLAVESVLDKSAVLVKLVEDPIRVLLHPGSKDYYLVKFAHLL